MGGGGGGGGEGKRRKRNTNLELPVGSDKCSVFGRRHSNPTNHYALNGKGSSSKRAYNCHGNQENAEYIWSPFLILY